MSFTYTTDGDTRHRELKIVDWLEALPDVLAEEAAEDHFDNHDGWESDWPLEIEVFKDKVSLGKFSVELERNPCFYAVEVKG